MTRILMCPPDYYRQDYAINPWMEDNTQAVLSVQAREQWSRLHDAIAAYADVTLIAPREPCADMVFAADAGVVSGDVAVLAHFRFPERQEEQDFYAQWFAEQGYDVRHLPDDEYLEGGDVYLDPLEPRLWAGFGFRSSVGAHRLAGEYLDREVVSLGLTDARFYHLDTCCAFLARGYVLYYPPALTDEALVALHARIAPDKRIVVEDEDALVFACNAVNVDDVIIANGMSDKLAEKLQTAGFKLVTTPLAEYLKVGGSARCMTLKV